MLSKFRLNDLVEFVDMCKDSSANINILDAINRIRFYRGSKKIARPRLEEMWYKSLSEGKPDYSIYESEDFLYDIWACWCIYSRKYLLSINSLKSLSGASVVSDIKDVKTIVDLGCGAGYTTAALKELFPWADIYGTNISSGYQYSILLKISQRYGFKVLSDIFKLERVDMIFASEFFEHIRNAVEYIEKIIIKYDPKYLIIANSFGTISVGHFYEYQYSKKLYDSRKTSRMFNKLLRDLGYEQVKTKIWNNKPSYWKKLSTQNES